jgi:YesN/AraC family two-component response regulator
MKKGRCHVRELSNGRKFKIGRVKREAFWNMKQPHYHDVHEIYYLISGERNFFIHETLYKIGKGDLVIVPAGELHRTTYVANNTHERIAMFFNDEMLEPLRAELGDEYVRNAMQKFFVHIPEGRRAYVEELMQKMMYEYDGIDELSDNLMQSYFQELFLFILRCEKNQTSEHEVDVANEIIQKAAKYISANYEKPVSLNDVANRFGMSSSYFSKKFKAVTGFGYKEYLTSLRIQEASTLLLTTNKSITDIAISCGFNDSNYFGDAFRRVKGISPNKYRKNKGSI